MKEATALRALEAVEHKYKKWMEWDDIAPGSEYAPKLVADWSLAGEPAEWAVVWEEGSPEEWALRWGMAGNEDPDGLFLEPLCSFALGVYPA